MGDSLWHLDMGRLDRQWLAEGVGRGSASIEFLVPVSPENKDLSHSLQSSTV